MELKRSAIPWDITFFLLTCLHKPATLTEYALVLELIALPAHRLTDTHLYFRYDNAVLDTEINVAVRVELTLSN